MLKISSATASSGPGLMARLATVTMIIVIVNFIAASDDA
jgi:hypothetical protein